MTVVQCPRCQFRVDCWFMSVDELLAVDHHLMTTNGEAHETKYCPFFEPDHYLPPEGPAE